MWIIFLTGYFTNWGNVHPSGCSSGFSLYLSLIIGRISHPIECVASGSQKRCSTM